MVQISYSNNVHEVWSALGPHLEADPVGLNVPFVVISGQLAQVDRATGSTPTLRCWWAHDGGTIRGFCLQGEPLGLCAVHAESRETAMALAEAVATTVELLPGVNGPVAAASAFVGVWASARHLPARATVLQRFYQLAELMPPPTVAGALRLATADDHDLAVDWSVAFQHDTFGPGKADRDSLDAMMQAKIADGLLWFWQTTVEPVAMTAATPIAGGVSRIQNVYTPPDHRRRGFAAAVVAGVVSQRLRSGADRCVLFTDLANPTSNSVYQRLGFTPHSEHINYELG